MIIHQDIAYVPVKLYNFTWYVWILFVSAQRVIFAYQNIFNKFS